MASPPLRRFDRSVKPNPPARLAIFLIALIGDRAPTVIFEPDVVEPPAVVHAVDHRRQALDLGMPAGRAADVEDDRPGALFLQPAVDIPDQLPSLFPVGLGGLTPERRFELAIAIAGEVAVRIAGIAFVELLVGVVDHRGRRCFPSRPCSRAA